MIKCPKCGAVLSDDSKFCSYCGAKIGETTPPPVEERPAVSEPSYSETVKSNFSRSAIPQSLADRIKVKACNQWDRLSVYGKITTIATVIFALLFLTAFLLGKTAAVLVAILQIILVVVSGLMRKQIIKVPKDWIHLLVLSLAVILFIPYVGLFIAPDSNASYLAWSDILLADVAPEPKSHVGEVLTNSDEYLSLHVYRTTAVEYDEYVKACIENGFTVEAEQNEQSYVAYNSDGYQLSLSFDESDSCMNIAVTAAKKYGTLTWPSSAIAGLLPVPKSTTGEIIQNDEHAFQAYISNTPLEAFNAYVTACANNGFNVNSNEIAKSYSAENEDGYQLSVLYQGNGVVSISVSEPEYTVSLEVNCTENLLFSKYDVDVYVNDSLQGTLRHGGTDIYNLNLTKGTYEVRFENDEDSDVIGITTIDVHQDETLKYKIYCTSSKIEVEPITESESAEESKVASEQNIASSTTENETVQSEILSSEATESTGTAEPVSEYELAFVRRLQSYSLYLMFDTDTKMVAQFGTDDTYLDKGSYTGDFSSGVTIAWDHGQFTEQFVYQDGSSTGTYIDGNGFDWEYSKCDLEEAQSLLDTRE